MRHTAGHTSALKTQAGGAVDDYPGKQAGGSLSVVYVIEIVCLCHYKIRMCQRK